jgi:hypothetical protein
MQLLLRKSEKVDYYIQINLISSELNIGWKVYFKRSNGFFKIELETKFYILLRTIEFLIFVDSPLKFSRIVILFFSFIPSTWLYPCYADPNVSVLIRSFYVI